MVEETIGLSREFIIHPGESLLEALEDRNMTQYELSVRTGVSEKHISTIISGLKNITPSFAKKLEYALGIDASFWMNLQNNYDQELLQFEELNSISEDEIDILNKFSELTDAFITYGFFKEKLSPVYMVLEYRKLLGMSNLLDIPKIKYHSAFRAQISNCNVDQYILFAWLKMCELLSEKKTAAENLDIDRLKKSIPEIKKTMFLKANLIEKRLSDIFSECGIRFCVVPNFKGAPVQGFIKRTDNENIILCVTLRQKYADIFWFTLFHEIGHIINGDTKRLFVDFITVSENNELKADMFARNNLINSRDYNAFIKEKGYKRSIEIKRFADTQNVRDFIVLGRLMKDGYIPWGDRTKYEWT
ncbi:HTH-type transcriptional regulator / antitoxin HigA [Ruminococcaceae bacterium YAD3003]|nr:HTH-type transcriptional regulator / antitoxin HigA [Ruminococcaceae bacterium YAD3003]